MRKLLTILILLCSAVCFSQAPRQLNGYNPLTQINFLGTAAVDSGLVFRTNFADTTTANLGWIKNIPNVLITIDDTLYKRSNDVTHWMQVGSGSGGGNTIYTGDGSLSGSRSVGLGGFSLTFGGGTSPTGNAGNVSIIGEAANNAGQAGSVIITGGLRDINGTGGDVIITSGGSNENDVGSMYLVGASATLNGKGGDINVTGGSANGDGESGGSYIARAGAGGNPNGYGGNILMYGGTAGVGGIAGSISFSSGNGNTTGNGGSLTLISGTGGATSGNGGDVTIQSGGAQGGDGNGGSVIVNTGEKNGTGTFGKFTVNYTSGGDPHPMFDINPSTQVITYTADTHTFNGVIHLPTQAAPASPNDGDIWREDNTNTGLKIRVNGITKTISLL